MRASPGGFGPPTAPDDFRPATDAGDLGTGSGLGETGPLRVRGMADFPEATGSSEVRRRLDCLDRSRVPLDEAEVAWEAEDPDRLALRWVFMIVERLESLVPVLFTGFVGLESGWGGFLSGPSHPVMIHLAFAGPN